MFLSAVWTLIVTAPIHCRGFIVMLNFSKYVLMKKQTHLHLGPAGEYVFSRGGHRLIFLI